MTGSPVLESPLVLESPVELPSELELSASPVLDASSLVGAGRVKPPTAFSLRSQVGLLPSGCADTGCRQPSLTSPRARTPGIRGVATSPLDVGRLACLTTLHARGWSHVLNHQHRRPPGLRPAHPRPGHLRPADPGHPCPLGGPPPRGSGRPVRQFDRRQHPHRSLVQLREVSDPRAREGPAQDRRSGFAWGGGFRFRVNLRKHFILNTFSCSARKRLIAARSSSDMGAGDDPVGGSSRMRDKPIARAVHLATSRAVQRARDARSGMGREGEVAGFMPRTMKRLQKRPLNLDRSNLSGSTLMMRTRFGSASCRFLDSSLFSSPTSMSWFESDGTERRTRCLSQRIRSILPVVTSQASRSYQAPRRFDVQRRRRCG